jgi:predicted DNA-binding transcriptional regulator AlpA
MKRWLRFRDLKNRGLVKSWPQIKRLIEEYGFPPGRMLSPNVRAWTDEEVEQYENSRPVAGPELRGIAKINRDRKAGSATTTTTA